MRPIAIAAAAFAVTLVVIVALADARQLGFLHRVYDFPAGDKVGHFVLDGFLAFLVTGTLGVGNRKRAVAAGLVIALVVSIEELS